MYIYICIYVYNIYIVPSLLTYNSGAWGLKMKEAHKIDIAPRKKPLLIIMEFKNSYKKLYGRCK